jgi:long-chain acyl-CoA synthetase
MNLVSLLENTARKHPFKRSIVSGKKKISYPQLNLLASQLASFLVKNKDLKKESKIAILHENSISYLVVLFAVFKAGLTAVPLNTLLKSNEIKFLLNNSQAELLISSSKFEDILADLKKECSSLKNIIVTDKRIENYLFLEEVSDKSCKTNINKIEDDNSTALICYTSSTTGTPKGAELSHKNVVSNINSCLEAVKIKSKDCFVLILPLFHSFSLTVSCFLPLAVGAKLVILQDVKSVKLLVRTIIFKRVTILVGIPQLFRVAAGIKLPKAFKLFPFLNPLRLAVSGGAALDEEIAVGFMKKLKVELLEGYGLTEASPVISINLPGKKNKPGSVGPPLVDVEVKTVDSEENEVPEGEVGELIVKGPNVMKGYYNMPHETSEAIRGGWLFTGDLAKINNEGYIYIVDRKKDLIISHGMNIYPREVEKAIELHPKVKEVAVIGKKDKHKGEIPLAVIVPEEGTSVSSREIREHCKECLANYKIPHSIEIRDELPKTPTGKVLKRVLRAEYK